MLQGRKEVPDRHWTHPGAMEEVQKSTGDLISGSHTLPRTPKILPREGGASHRRTPCDSKACGCGTWCPGPNSSTGSDS